jgi:hypothetical protein
MQTLEEAIFVKYSACLFTLGKFVGCKSASCSNLVFGELDWVSAVGPCQALPGRATRVCVTINSHESGERVEVTRLCNIQQFRSQVVDGDTWVGDMSGRGHQLASC